jgi:ubiquinone/menaquinone biosynthesis C-methylase UbiE
MSVDNSKENNLVFQNKSQEITYFNNFTREKDYDSLTPYGYQSIIIAFHQCLGERFSQVRNAVDLGCGSGSFTRRFFNKEGINCFGVDIALQAIQRARSNDDGIYYFVSDISQAGIKSESMDLIIFSGVLHHFLDMTACLNEAYRILKKGGTVLSYDPHINNPCMWLYRHPGSIFYSKAGKTDNEKLLSKKEMQEALQKSKFCNIKTVAISGVTISYLESPLARLFLPLYNTLEYFLGLLPIAKNIGSFLICYAEKEK